MALPDEYDNDKDFLRDVEKIFFTLDDLENVSETQLRAVRGTWSELYDALEMYSELQHYLRTKLAQEPLQEPFPMEHVENSLWAIRGMIYYWKHRLLIWANNIVDALALMERELEHDIELVEDLEETVWKKVKKEREEEKGRKCSGPPWSDTSCFVKSLKELF